MTTAAPKLPPALDVGIFVSCSLYGLTVLQTVYYYMTFPHDLFHLKALVAILWVLDTLQLVMACHAAYWYLITSFGKYAVLDVVTWSLTADVFLTSAIAFMVQMYMIRRIFILSQRNWIISGFLALISLLALGSGFAYGGRLAQLGRTHLIPTILYLIRTALGSTLAVDALITISLIFFLNKNRTGMKGTDTLVNFLIIFTVNTGAITSLCALLDVIFHTAMPETTAYMSFYVILSKLYVNSFLGTLNAREVIRGHSGNYQVSGGSSSQRTAHFSTNPSSVTHVNRRDLDGVADDSASIDMNLGAMKFAQASSRGTIV